MGKIALILMAFTLAACSTLTTPMRECKSMCSQDKVRGYWGSDGERCPCGDPNKGLN
jgi:hypothetical protein